jgi:hypothetical protein
MCAWSEPGYVMKTERRQLSWRFLLSIALIAATVTVATMIARWTGRLG